MRGTRFVGAGISVLVAACAVVAALAQEVHYSPEEDLAQIDAQLISEAKTSIDFASYALTDRVIVQALAEADRHGIAIRIVLDPRKRHDFVALGDLADNVRIKRGSPYMHLKAYSIDGQVSIAVACSLWRSTSSFRTLAARSASASIAAACLPKRAMISYCCLCARPISWAI